VTIRQTRFDHVITWLAEAGPEDLADLRREIEEESREFAIYEADHRRNMESLRLVESILAARCGDALVALDRPPVVASSSVVQGNWRLSKIIEWKEVTADEAEPNPAEAPSQAALDTFLGEVGLESTEPITSSESSVDEREPPPGEDDDRSVEDRIRDLLAKVGERSARQIGAQIGIEKSVVLEMLESSRLFLKVKSADYDDLPAVNRPWKLSKAGRG
jgi:hypothetical protein